MTDLLFQMGLSNVCFSLCLAIVATVVGARTKRSQLAHLLWLLVFVKLVTPPIVTISVVTIPEQGETAGYSSLGALVSDSPEPGVGVSPWSKLGLVAWSHARVWLPPIWLLGSVVVFSWSIVRICRFSRLLAAESDVAPRELQIAAEKTARRLGLKTIPIICTTLARISPMVWWTGGKVRIVIPTTLLDKMDTEQSQWVLAHELAHVRRRDYLVRWLEWVACVVFWWNPVVWWAQRNLRATEEICCDELVISCLNPKPKSYANSLLLAVEFLARPALRPPAMASEINSGGFLERRFKMIVSDNPRRPNCRRVQICVLLCAVLVLPLGIASARDYKAVERRLGEAVSNGELSLDQASLMMDALRKAGGAKKQIAKTKGETDVEKAWKKLQAMVKGGEITEEQAAAKMAGIKKEAAKKEQESDRVMAYLMKVKEELGAAVETGRISKEEAARRFEAAKKGIKERMAEQGERGERRAMDRGAPGLKDMPIIGMFFSSKDYGRIEAELKKAVAAGRISEEEMEKRLIRMRQEMAGQRERGDRGITVEEYRRAEAKMKRMVDEGKAKPENVERRLIEMRKMIGDQTKLDGERENREPPDWEGIKRRIEGAVKSGKMTREEADEKYKEIRERMAGRRER